MVVVRDSDESGESPVWGDVEAAPAERKRSTTARQRKASSRSTQGQTARPAKTPVVPKFVNLTLPGCLMRRQAMNLPSYTRHRRYGRTRR
jgi:hypothetical protein